MTLNLPKYYLIFDRAVKVVPTENGGSRILTYNALDDTFEEDPSVVRYVFFPDDETELDHRG